MSEAEDKKEAKPKVVPVVVVRRSGTAVETKPSTEVAEAKPTAATAPAAKPSAPAPAALPPLAAKLTEEVPEPESFAEMFEKSAKTEGLPQRKGPRAGDKVSGKIFQLGADTAFITLEGHREAMIDLGELKDDQGILRLGVGDTVDAYVLETGAKGIILSRRLSKGAASMSRLADARISGVPVEGLVIAVNKGGLEVALGDVRAFCPSSQVDVRPAGKLEGYVGERLTFRVMEMKDKSVVVSRRAIVEEEMKGLAEETRKTLAVGKVLKGKVTSVRDFGAFVDLGGLEGMIPVSELSHQRVKRPDEIVSPGDLVEVEVLRMEEAQPKSPDKSKHKERITLSMRALQEDPFKAALAEFKEGTRAKGKVVRLQPFGAFVELKPGVDGLIHISAMSERRIAHPRDVLQVGQEIEVVVEKTDEAEKRIGLRLVKDGQPIGEGVATSAPAKANHEGAPQSDDKPRAPRAKRGQIVTGKIERIEPFGIFIAFEGGKGLIPASETGTDRGTDLRRAFALNQEVKAEIIEMEGSKLKLSITSAVRTEERAELDAWKKTQKNQGSGGKGFGTFADLLKNAKV